MRSNWYEYHPLYISLKHTFMDAGCDELIAHNLAYMQTLISVRGW